MVEGLLLRERTTKRKAFFRRQVEPKADVSDPEHRRWFRQMQLLPPTVDHPNVAVPRLFTREGNFLTGSANYSRFVGT